MSNKYYYTSDNLIEAVKRKASIPDSQSFITDDEILIFANEEMEINLLQLITKRHEDYFLTREDIPIETGVTAYEIPYRAIGSKLREVAYTEDGESLGAMNRISIDELTGGHSSVSVSTGIGSGGKYYIQNENIVLNSMSSDVKAGGYLAMFYNLRPNSMVESDRVGIIESIDRDSGIITLTEIPDDFDITSEYDFIKTRSPHKIYTYDIAITELATSTSTMTFDPEDIPSQLSIGDRISLAGETDVINCPSELHSMLAELVVARIMESIGDTDNLGLVNNKIAKLEVHVGDLLDNRVNGSPIKVKANNSFLRGKRRR